MVSDQDIARVRGSMAARAIRDPLAPPACPSTHQVAPLLVRWREQLRVRHLMARSSCADVMRVKAGAASAEWHLGFAHETVIRY
jgi:tRNA U34 5-methylaminomethyl-2-thiouridine-forming methyltransferase MnmC